MALRASHASVSCCPRWGERAPRPEDFSYFSLERVTQVLWQGLSVTFGRAPLACARLRSVLLMPYFYFFKENGWIEQTNEAKHCCEIKTH